MTTWRGLSQNGLSSQLRPFLFLIRVALLARFEPVYQKRRGDSPLATRRFRDDRHKPLQAPQDRTVDHDRPPIIPTLNSVRRLLPDRRRRGSTPFHGLLRRRSRRAIFQIKPFRQIKVQLDGTALPRPLQRVYELEIEFRSVERCVFFVDVPLSGHLLVQDRSEGLFGIVPDGEVAHPFVRITGGETDFECKAERKVDGFEEFECGADLLADLVECTEDVSWSLAAERRLSA